MFSTSTAFSSSYWGSQGVVHCDVSEYLAYYDGSYTEGREAEATSCTDTFNPVCIHVSGYLLLRRRYPLNFHCTVGGYAICVQLLCRYNSSCRSFPDRRYSLLEFTDAVM
jgi:hypothetical protein